MKLLNFLKAGQNQKKNLKNLRTFNFVMAGLHFLQALIILIISSDFRVPLVTNFLSFNDSTKQLEAASQRMTDIPFVWFIVIFFLASAAAHLCVATFCRKSYEKDLKNGINRVRWIEYAFSASTMMIAIAMLAGVYDLSTLLLMFVLTAGMNLMGLAMELWNLKSDKTNWFSYWVGCGLGIAPWIVYVIYLWGSAVYGDAKPPTFVYFILVSIFLMFNSFAVNMWLQYKKKGPWANYLYGERVYIILSLVAKSALAWQVFAGTLRP